MNRKITYPKKRIVILEYKETQETRTYNTCAELAIDNPRSKIGICLGSLWNALSKNNGVFENDKCRIYYRKINSKINTEWR